MRLVQQDFLERAEDLICHLKQIASVSFPVDHFAAGQLQRQFSFADESLDEISTQIREEEPALDWLATRHTRLRSACGEVSCHPRMRPEVSAKEDFWNRVLVGSPPSECRGLSTRSISYWVRLLATLMRLVSTRCQKIPVGLCTALTRRFGQMAMAPRVVKQNAFWIFRALGVAEYS